MSVYLRKTLCQVNVENGKFSSTRDEQAALMICELNSLHSFLETANVFNQTPSDILGSKNEKYLHILTVCIKTAPDKWIQAFVEGFNDENTCSLCINSIRAIAKCAEICNKHDDCDFDTESTKDDHRRVVIVLHLLQTLFRRLISCSNEADSVDFNLSVCHVGFFLFLVAIQHVNDREFKNQSLETLANECVQLIQGHFQCDSVEMYLLKNIKQCTPVQETEFQSLEKKCIVGKILLLWKPFLCRNKWKKYPTVCNGLSNILHVFKFPNISPFIGLFLPPCLLFLDDYVVNNKEQGLSCLIHMLRNTGAEEIRWYGRADVIYEALKLQLYSTEETILTKTHEALLLILKVIVCDAHKIDAKTKYDEIFSMIVQAAYQENKLVLRKVHTEQLSEFIQLMGINVVKYMKELLDLIGEYLEIEGTSDERARLNTLHALKALITVAWPRIPAHSVTILKLLVKFLHHLTSGDCDFKEADTELIHVTSECLKLLCGLDCHRMKECLNTLCNESFPFSTKCREILKQCEQDLS
ncbi:TEL2-interacting protein 2 [Mactra antiquata]